MCGTEFLGKARENLPTPAKPVVYKLGQMVNIPNKLRPSKDMLENNQRDDLGPESSDQKVSKREGKEINERDRSNHKLRLGLLSTLK